MRHIISSSSFTKEALIALFAQTTEIKRDPASYQKALSGKVIATLFYEPSTRTRLSFESAILRLGAHLISMENASVASSTVKGESLADMIRIVEGYADAIVMRHYENNAAAKASEVASIPVVNAGDGSGEHPTQALLDCFTIWEERAGLDELSIAVIGDLRYGRTVHSLVKLLSLFPKLTVYGVSLEGLGLGEVYIRHIETNGGKYVSCSSLMDVPDDIDVLYQTRTQRERMNKHESDVEEIIIDLPTLQRFAAHTMVLHPLPRNEEIAPEVDADPRARYFEQAKNGMWVRMALLYTLLAPVSSH
jgi:aspartate carbamoyltransferase catalytic subunit